MIWYASCDSSDAMTLRPIADGRPVHSKGFFMSFTFPALARTAAVVTIFLAAACVGAVDRGMPGAIGTKPDAETPTTPTPSGPPVLADVLPPQVYAAKVKNLLTGLALTDDELRAVVASSNQLGTLIDAWQKTPEFRTRMLKFFGQAFQQTQTDPTDYVDLIGQEPKQWGESAMFLRSAEEMFARTVLQLIDEGRPFTDAMTTDRFMLNAPMMAVLGYIDAVPRNDLGAVITASVWPMQKPEMKNLSMSIVYETNAAGAAVSIPWADSIDPKSPNWMRFSVAKPYVLADVRYTHCVEPQVTKALGALTSLLPLMFGRRPGNCGTTASQFTAEDWNTWKMVRIRPPKVGEERTAFWDLPKLRDPNLTELVMDTPRVGFLTTLAFMANWPTNDSNASRVITNQAIIVGLNRSFDDRGTTVAVAESADEAKHSMPGTVCYGCHQTLDPMRDFYRQSYAVSYFKQLAPNNPKNLIPAVGTFSVDGSPPSMGNGIAVFAASMAAHPGFAAAWTQKFCRFANSAACDETDPEFIRVATAWKAGGFQFNVLIRELFSSPLVTYSAKTKTAAVAGTVISIARQETFCTALENRLKIANACGLEPGGNAQRRNLALSIPGAAYTRGNDAPLTPHDPSLFFMSAGENLCTYVSMIVVDAGVATRYASATPVRREEALTDFVATVMGIAPSDTRHQPLRAMLSAHMSDALKVPGAKPADALRSTFIVACASPYALALGL